MRQHGIVFFFLVCISHFWMVSKTRFICRSSNSNDPSLFRMKRTDFRTLAHLSQMLCHDFIRAVFLCLFQIYYFNHCVASSLEILSKCFRIELSKNVIVTAPIRNAIEGVDLYKVTGYAFQIKFVFLSFSHTLHPIQRR